MNSRLVILGSGEYGRTVADVAEQLAYNIQFLDDSIPDHPLSSFIDFVGEDVELFPAFGNNEFRLSWCEKITTAGGALATLIHPTAYVSPRASVSAGTVILPHAIINTGVVINRGCIINLGSIVDHTVSLKKAYMCASAQL